MLFRSNVASAAIYNVEYRPIDEKDFYEISLDSTSFIFNFEPTKKTNLSESVSIGSSTIIVDSSVGFAKSGFLIAKSSNLVNPITLSYKDRDTTEFTEVSGVIADLNYGDEIIEENLLYSNLDDGTKVEFRALKIGRAHV